MCQLFMFPPLGLLNLTVSKSFSWPVKMLTLLLSIILVVLMWWSRDLYQEHLNELWLSKYNQMRREFRYQKAGSYLYKRKFSKPEEKLMELLLRMDFEYSVGSKHAIEIRNEAELVLTDLFTETLAEYINLLNGSELVKRKNYSADQVLNFYYYYQLFCKEGDLSWDVNKSPIPTMQQGLELLSNDPEKLNKLKLLRKNFEIILASLTDSKTQNLLTPLVIEWRDIEKIELLMTYASVCRVLLDYRGGLKFYFYAYAALAKNDSNDTEQVNWIESLDQVLDDFVDQSPFHLKAYMLRGLFKLRSGQLRKAREDFEHVFKLDVNFPQVWELLQTLDMESSDIEAMSLYHKAEILRFGNARFEKSLAIFDSLLQRNWEGLDRFRDELLFNMGVMYRNNLKNYEEAIKCFNQILEIRDSFRHEEARYNLIMCHYYRRDFEAMESLTVQFMKSHSNSDRVPRIVMINVGMKLIKVFKKVLNDLILFGKMESGNG